LYIVPCFRREERKWIEKQNKAARAKRKKEEMARIRNLVDTAYSLDPRIQKFKQEDKDRKLAVKQAKKDAARARQEEEDRVRKLTKCTSYQNSANTNFYKLSLRFSDNDDLRHLLKMLFLSLSIITFYKTTKFWIWVMCGVIR